MLIEELSRLTGNEIEFSQDGVSELAVEDQQSAALILALGQGALEPLLTMPTKFGKASEHSQVRIE